MTEGRGKLRILGSSVLANSGAWVVGWALASLVAEFLDYPLAVLVGATTGGTLAAFSLRSLSKIGWLSRTWIWRAATGWALAWAIGIAGVGIGGALAYVNEYLEASGDAQLLGGDATPYLVGGVIAAMIGGIAAGAMQWSALRGEVSGLGLVIGSALGWPIAWALALSATLGHLQQSGGDVAAYQLPDALLIGMVAGAVLGAIAGIPLLSGRASAYSG